MSTNELLHGWAFNEARVAEGADIGDGVWEIGHLNEDDVFAAVVTVDTGNYFQPQDAEPLARAILARINSPTATDAQGVGEAPKAVAEGELYLGLCLDDDRKLHATIMRKEINGHVTVLLSDCATMPRGHDVIMRIGTHPTASTTAGLTEVAMLTDAELRTAWEACEETGYLEWAAIVQRACAEKWNVRLDGGAAK